MWQYRTLNTEMEYLIFAVVSLLFDAVESQPDLELIPTWPYEPFGAEIMIPLGSDLKIKCHTTKTQSPLAWNVESKGVSSAKFKIENGPGWASYSIEKTQKEDYGRYTCEDRTGSSLKQRIVVFSPDIIFNTIISGETITNKSTVDYRVISKYDDITYYSYRKVDLPEDKLPIEVQTSGFYMRISEVKSETEGSYACTVQADSTAVGVIRVVFTTQLLQHSSSCLKIGIIARGYRPNQYRLQEFMEGSPLLLRCDSTFAYYPPEWKKSNEDITITDTTKRSYIYGRCLVFTRLTQADTAMYTCYHSLEKYPQFRVEDEMLVTVTSKLESSWEDMDWEITWTAGEFSPLYTYDIKKYCELADIQSDDKRAAEAINKSDGINKKVKCSQLSITMAFIFAIKYILT